MLRLYRHWLLLALMASVACAAGCSAIASYYAGEAGPVADGSTPDASFDARAQPPLDGPLDGAVTDQLEDLPSAEPSATDTTGDRSKVTIVDTLADMPRPPDDAGSVSGFVVCGGANNAWCQPTQRPTTYALRGIWGRSARDVYAVGDAGTILHYDGSSWTPMPSGVGVQLNAVFGVGNKVYAVGNSGTILELDTTNSWQSMTSGTTQSLWSVWASPVGVYVVGNTQIRALQPNRTWADETPANSFSLTLTAVFGEGTTVMAVGTDSSVGVTLVRQGNGSWTQTFVGGYHRALWMSGGEGFLAGKTGVSQPKFLHNAGSGAFGDVFISGVGSPNGVFGRGPSDVFIVGDGGNLWRYSGGTAATAASSGVVDNLYALWAVGNHVFIVGAAGLVMHTDK